MRRALLAEGLGAMLLSATVIGSGIMAERLAGGNLAVALIANTFAGIAPNNAPAFIVSQLCGALIGLMLAKWLQIGTASIPRVDEGQIEA